MLNAVTAAARRPVSFVSFTVPQYQREDSYFAPLSELTAEYARYVASGEINSEVADQTGRSAAVREAFAGRPGVSVDDLDGMTVSGDGWWFNLRPSNTEPLLRLNVEARNPGEVAALRDEVLAIVRSPEA